MSNLKEIRTRITSISKSMQITSAMKMVSAARLKKSQDKIEKMRPYAEKMNKLISDLSANSEVKVGLTDKRENKKTLFIFLSSNKGLCGSFNTSLVKYVVIYHTMPSIINTGTDSIITLLTSYQS